MKRVVLQKRMAATLVIVLILMASSVQGGIIYVDADAPGANTGANWMDAYRHLQDALAYVGCPCQPVEIRVARGEYRPDQGAGQVAGNRQATFQLRNKVTLKGGYAGFGESDPDARDIEAYETILSGDLAGDDPFVVNPESMTFDPNREENTYRIVTGSMTDETAVLDGFTITGGHANYEDFSECNGAGMYNHYGTPTVNHCTFRHNFAGNDDGGGSGGGMYNFHSDPKLSFCTFRANAAIALDGGEGRGAGMYNRENHPQLNHCTFQENVSGHNGGGMYNYDSTLVLNDCWFIGNVARQGGSGSHGGGMWNYGSNCRLTRCFFQGNTAQAEYKSGGGGMWNAYNEVTLDGCMFGDNTGGYGGGMYNEYNIVILRNGAFINNTAFLPDAEENPGGGGIYNDSSELTIAECVFADNSVKANYHYGGDGGAIFSGHSIVKMNHCFLTNNTARRYGGGMCNWWNGEATVTHCTFSQNQADADSGGVDNYESQLAMTNCILWQDDPEEIYAEVNDPVTITYCDVMGGWLGEGNINTDPLFSNHGDTHLKSQAGRWNPNTHSWEQDEVTSPCIDAGDPATLIGWEPFPNGGVVNMGAYGGTNEASKSWFGKPNCEIPIAGDINGDCVVDMRDLSIMANHWLEESK